MDSEQCWRGNFCIELSAAPGTLVIFGASGDLANRKLFPSLFELFRRGLLHEDSHIIGCARHDYDDNTFRESLKRNLEGAPEELEAFCGRIGYQQLDYHRSEDFTALKLRLEEYADGRITFYLAIPQLLYPQTIANLSAAGLLKEHSDDDEEFRHVVIEKPFGSDFDSAHHLDSLLHRYVREHQIYRIDHYLGKDTVQNILMLRFANLIFEPVWNRQYIDRVEIIVAETLGVEHRAGYYEKAGLLRDMFQNHMLEMLSLVAMEMPPDFSADAVRDEKLKLIDSIRPFDLKKLDKLITRAQYTAGNGMAAYRSEPGVAADSETETLVDATFFIDNWRWSGVPFRLISGKRLARKYSRIEIVFKPIPHSIFDPIRPEELARNRLILEVQPEEGFALHIQAKEPGPKLCMGELALAFDYRSLKIGGKPLDAYARLLLDCMLGDQTLFIRNDIIAASWRLFTPVLEHWRELCPLRFYPAGSTVDEATAPPA